MHTSLCIGVCIVFGSYVWMHTAEGAFLQWHVLGVYLCCTIYTPCILDFSGAGGMAGPMSAGFFLASSSEEDDDEDECLSFLCLCFLSLPSFLCLCFFSLPSCMGDQCHNVSAHTKSFRVIKRGVGCPKSLPTSLETFQCLSLSVMFSSLPLQHTFLRFLCSFFFSFFFLLSFGSTPISPSPHCCHKCVARLFSAEVRPTCG